MLEWGDALDAPGNVAWLAVRENVINQLSCPEFLIKSTDMQGYPTCHHVGYLAAAFLESETTKANIDITAQQTVSNFLARTISRRYLATRSTTKRYEQNVCLSKVVRTQIGHGYKETIEHARVESWGLLCSAFIV